jgi:hypothetical protein
MPKNFCKNWKDDLAKQTFGWICGDKYAAWVSIHLSETSNYLTSGSEVAQKFGFLEPTKVQLQYTIYNNQFEMKILPKISKEKKFPEVINIYDSEDESDDYKNPALFQKQLKPIVVVYNLYIVFF